MRKHRRNHEAEYERGLLGWIVIGLIAGWLAGKIARGAGYGCITDIILGLVGSVLGAFGGILYTKLVLQALTTVWRSAVGAVIVAIPPRALSNTSEIA